MSAHRAAAWETILLTCLTALAAVRATVAVRRQPSGLGFQTARTAVVLLPLHTSGPLHLNLVGRRTATGLLLRRIPRVGRRILRRRILLVDRRILLAGRCRSCRVDRLHHRILLHADHCRILLHVPLLLLSCRTSGHHPHSWVRSLVHHHQDPLSTCYLQTHHRSHLATPNFLPLPEEDDHHENANHHHHHLIHHHHPHREEQAWRQIERRE
mmetsp:Transcript_15273/g.38609  ORF Transcript_15273/g.38609 Transcript_15273/m.38609 type:complete len:212 (-) Transcript_15273:60-695(-)